MILVTLGTQDQKMYRLLDMLEHSNIKDEIIVQAGGSSDYKSDKMKIFKFVSMSEMNRLLDKADIVITHGGSGSILAAIKKNKLTLAIPRLSKYGEHINDHQTEIVSEYVKEGYILDIKEKDNIEDKIKELKKFKPKKFVSNKRHFIEEIKKLIDE